MSSTVKALLASLAVFVLIIVGFLSLVTFEDVAPPPPADLDVASDVEDVESPGTPAADRGREFVGTPVAREAVKITVNVLEKSSGRPLPKAQVRVSRSSEGDRPGALVWDSARGGRSDGIFEVELVPGAYVVQAQARGFTGDRQPLTVVKDQPQQITFHLEEGNSISGRVLDTGNRGIAGARVLALKNFAPPDADLETVLMELIKLPEITNEVFAETYSAEDGSYQLDGLEVSWFTVRAVAQGYSPGEVKQVPAPREQVDVVLEAGGNVGGLVTDMGARPVQGAKVYAYRETDSQAMFEIILAKSRPPVDTADSDASGRFEFQTLGTGLYNFRVAASGFQPHTESKIHVRSDSELKFQLKEGLSVTGVVQGPNDEPVGGATIRAQRIGGSATRPEIVNISFDEDGVKSDENGVFVFDTLEDADYNLVAMHDDYQTLRHKGVRPGSGEVRLRMTFGGRIRGFVTDTSGQPVAGARLVAGDVADNTKEAVTDETGQFVLHGLQTGSRTVSVNVTADGYARVRREVKVPESREVEESFELEPTSRLRGIVVNSAGDPVRGAMIMVKRKQENSSVDSTVANGRTDARGVYEIPQVEAGENLWVRVKHSGFLEGRSEPFSLEPGTEIELPAVRLDLGGTVAGKVVGPDGSGVGGCVVTMILEGQSENTASLNPSVTTNAQGEFQLRGLASGTIDLVVKPTDMLDKVIPGVEVEEGRVVSDIVVTLESGSTLSGRVVNDQGEAVAGATIIAHDFSQGAAQVRAVSDGTGRFRLGRIVASETVELEVNHSDYATWTDEKVAVGSEIEITLKQLGLLTGVVVNASGEPVASFSVQPEPEEGGSRSAKSRLRARTFSSGDGQFSYPGVAGGVYTVDVRAPGLSGATIEGVRVVEGEATDLGQIALELGGGVSGRVVDGATGEPVFGARITIVQGSSRFLAPDGPAPSGARSRQKSTQNTDSNGTFSFDGLKGGNLTLRVKHSDYVEEKVTANPDVAAQSRDLVVQLSRAGEISGTVLNPDGQPRANMQIYLIGDDPAGNQRARTNSEGKFTFRSVIPGEFTVKAHEFGQGENEPIEAAEVRVSIGSGQSQTVLLQLD